MTIMHKEFKVMNGSKQAHFQTYYAHKTHILVHTLMCVVKKNTSTHTHTHTSTHTQAHTQAYTSTHTQAHISTHTHTYTHTHTNTIRKSIVIRNKDNDDDD
jgi:hypothetical protein